MTGWPVQRFEGLSAVVTGAAHGIGRACAARLASEGAQVAVTDLDRVAADEVVAALRGTGATPRTRWT